MKVKYLIFIALTLSIIAGLRKESVGIDTMGYVNAIEQICNGRIQYAYGFEWTFRYICYGISLFIDNPHIFLFIFALITNICIVFRLWDFRMLSSFKFSVIAYYISFYFMSLNITRQFIALGIVFWATRYLANQKHAKYLVYILIASLFHKTALIGITFLFVNVLMWPSLSRKQKNFLLLIFLVSPYILLLINNLGESYSKYFFDKSISIGIMSITRLVFALTCLLTSKFYRSREKDLEGVSKDYQLKLAFINKSMNIYYLMGVILTSMGYVWKFVDRISLYWLLYEPVFMGRVIYQKNTKSNFLLKIVTIIFYVSIFGVSFVSNGQGQLPYFFFWQ